MTLFLQGLLILALVVVNAFFVAAEFALLSIRRSRLQQLVRLGSVRATLVQKLLAYPSRLFSGLQLGVTAASLLLGWLGESMLAEDIRVLLEDRMQHWVGLASHGTATLIAFLLITGLLMVLGELAPKTIGYERAEKVSLLVSLAAHRLYARGPLSGCDHGLAGRAGGPRGRRHGFGRPPARCTAWRKWS